MNECIIRTIKPIIPEIKEEDKSFFHKFSFKTPFWQYYKMMYEKKYDAPAQMSLEMEIRKGFSYLIVGDNGAGKTTLVEALDPLGKNRHFMRLEYFGKPLEDFTNVNEIASKIACSYANWQKNHLPSFLNAYLLEKIYSHFGVSFNHEYFSTLLSAFEIKKDDFFYSLSDGQKALVSFSVAVAREPEVLLIDEITSFLSSTNKELVYDILRNYIDDDGEHTLIITTNHLDDIRHLPVDYCFVLNDSSISYILSGDEVGEAKIISDLKELRYGQFYYTEDSKTNPNQ